MTVSNAQSQDVQPSFLGAGMDTTAELIRVAGLFYAGVWTPAVGRLGPLAEAAAAQ